MHDQPRQNWILRFLTGFVGMLVTHIFCPLYIHATAALGRLILFLTPRIKRPPPPSGSSLRPVGQ